jgi:hypothetical protein
MLRFASNISKSLALSVVMAVVFSIPVIMHAVEEEIYYIVDFPDEIEQLLKVAVSVTYPIAAFLLGFRAASRSRGTISGFTLGLTRACVETVVHPRYLSSYSEIRFLDALMSVQVGAILQAEPLLVVFNFLLRNLNYILLGVFVASLGGLSRYLDRLSKPLEKKTVDGNGVHVFRDYLSNRQMFDKNRFKENPSLDLSRGDKPSAETPAELYLSQREERVDVIDLHDRKVLAADLVNPKLSAAQFEPVWNPIPLAMENKITKIVMPLSIGLSILSVLISFTNIVPLLEPFISNLGYVSLPYLLNYITTVGAVLLNTIFPVLLVLILSFVLIAKVRRLRKIKPESSLTLLFLTLILPVITYGTSSLSYSLMVGNDFIANLWMLVLLASLVIIFISSLRIREFENVSIYFYQNTQDRMAPLWYPQDKPLWVQGEYYWVFRYMYFWPIEMTIPLPHTDWERVEVWVNAKSGQVEWIATDYHYRELWYQVVGNVPRVFVDFDPNFHTPLPITFYDELDYIQKVIFYKLSVLSLIGSQLRYILKGKWYNLWAGISFEGRLRETYRQMHPEDFISRITGSKMLASRLASLHWRNWRYPQGADRKDIYSAVAKNLPATLKS